LSTTPRVANFVLKKPFPDLDTLEATAEAIGSNMFEGFTPTRKGIEIIRDYCLGKISFAQLLNRVFIFSPSFLNMSSRT
jgi:putative transcriptional regulator